MSRLSDLVQAVKRESPNLGDELAAEIKTLLNRRTFGLVFERHQPEAVELPGVTIEVGSKVHILSPRGSTAKQDKRLWIVQSLEKGSARIVEHGVQDPEARTVSLDDLVVVAEFRDPIFPGLLETGRVERGGDKPFHTVINAENFHALEMLIYTHRGKVDAIYIDPPYNTGAKDWKYNNDYVEGDDDYRHSKWLAFMERRLRVARELLNPSNSVLIVTIDEKEVHRLALLLEQVFPEARIQMISAVINPKGTSRPDLFSRVEEHIFFVLFGDAKVPSVLDSSTAGKPVRWRYLRREDLDSVRGSRPRQFYPVFISKETSTVMGVGRPLSPEEPLDAVTAPEGTTAVYPVREDGLQMEWGLTGPALMRAAEQGYVRATTGHQQQPYIISYLTAPNIKKVASGELLVTGTRDDGSKIVVAPTGKMSRPVTVWKEARHSAGDYGTKIINSLIPNRKFPFPKSLYAVEDTIRFFVGSNPNAVVLDFFSGSGTTAHAVMRLNRQDGGRRQCISVTNNEVSAEEQTRLRRRGLRPGDSEWEALGICDYITKPRLTAAITGQTPQGQPIKGDYKFTDEFPMSDGFEENAVFYTLTYESALRVRYDLAFERIAPMLWLRAGARGRTIKRIGELGFEITETYAVLKEPDQARELLSSLGEGDGIRIVYVVTDDSSVFQAVAQDLPEHVEAVQLYSSYLRNFEINRGRA